MQLHKTNASDEYWPTLKIKRWYIRINSTKTNHIQRSENCHAWNNLYSKFFSHAHPINLHKINSLKSNTRREDAFVKSLHLLSVQRSITDLRLFIDSHKIDTYRDPARNQVKSAMCIINYAIIHTSDGYISRYKETR